MKTMLVNGSLTDDDVKKIGDSVDASIALIPFSVSLQPEDRMHLRKKGTKRAGYVDDSFDGITTHTDSIPSKFDLAGYQNRKALDAQLRTVLDKVNTLRETIDDTLLALGSDLMHQSDEGYSYLQTAAKNSGALTDTVAKISKAFKGQG